MKNNFEAVIFTENPFDLFRIAVPILIFLLLTFSVAFVFIGSTPDKDGKVISFDEYFLVVIAVHAFLLLLFFIVCGFKRKTIVTCDSETCDIYSSNFWNTFFETHNFRWNDAADTNINEEAVDGGLRGVFLDIKVNSKQIRLMMHNPVHQKPFVELLTYVNQATPHLNYVLEKTSESGNRQVIYEVRKFCKLART